MNVASAELFAEEIIVLNALGFLSHHELAMSSLAFPRWFPTLTRHDLLWEPQVARQRKNKQVQARQRPAEVSWAIMRVCMWFQVRPLPPDDGTSFFMRFLNGERDSRRTIITTQELCEINWRFSDGLQRPRFRANGELHMDLYPTLKWSFNINGSIQIENFPPHTVERTTDWGWKIFNRNVSFYSGEHCFKLFVISLWMHLSLSSRKWRCFGYATPARECISGYCSEPLTVVVASCTISEPRWTFLEHKELISTSKYARQSIHTTKGAVSFTFRRCLVKEIPAVFRNQRKRSSCSAMEFLTNLLPWIRLRLWMLDIKKIRAILRAFPCTKLFWVRNK